MKELVDLLNKIKEIELTKPKAPNFFDAGGLGYLENPISDLMAVFMGKNKHCQPWLTKGLIACLASKGVIEKSLIDDTKWDTICVEREYAYQDQETGTYKRIDILISSNTFVLAIENKVFSGAERNPFHTYDKLINQIKQERKEIRCVLRPNTYSKDTPPHWSVVSYAELIDSAVSRLGEDTYKQQHSKWHVFYQEFLQHLDTLAHPEKAHTMSSETMKFAMENFNLLRKANEILNSFENELRQEGKETVSSALTKAGKESALRTAAHQWANGERALRFYPEKWGGDSQIVLVYSNNTEPGEKSGIYFHITAFIDKKHSRVELTKLQELFAKIMKQNPEHWRKKTMVNHSGLKKVVNYLPYASALLKTASAESITLLQA